MNGTKGFLFIVLENMFPEHELLALVWICSLITIVSMIWWNFINCFIWIVISIHLGWFKHHYMILIRKNPACNLYLKKKNFPFLDLSYRLRHQMALFTEPKKPNKRLIRGKCWLYHVGGTDDGPFPMTSLRGHEVQSSLGLR